MRLFIDYNNYLTPLLTIFSINLSLKKEKGTYVLFFFFSIHLSRFLETQKN